MSSYQILVISDFLRQSLKFGALPVNEINAKYTKQHSWI
ncbi:unnamed protein product [Brugia timori]|uniref:Uncharacterized protein n=1 Tax=Brugia timori TaxID=42155 RepID=A0A3P7X2M9_9BILA|nr:unnamed protein product [Brugia timori]